MAAGISEAEQLREKIYAGDFYFSALAIGKVQSYQERRLGNRGTTFLLI
jgi:hypothetical protein